MSKINLLGISSLPPQDLDKEVIKDETRALIKKLDELQNLMFAEGKHSLLVVLQGMDASGKSGAVRKVFRYVNPMGVRVHSFKKPTKLEMAHDMLWRVHEVVPSKGMIQVFDRSHYEEVLITRVEGWCDDETAMKRFAHINNFERLLQDYNTHILKFYLHISEEKQQASFYERMTDPRKNWKYGPEDIDKAKKWPAYRSAYEDVFKYCSPESCPWIIVPSDKNWYKEYVVAKTIVQTLESLNMQYPKASIDVNDPDVRKILDQFDYNDESGLAATEE